MIKLTITEADAEIFQKGGGREGGGALCRPPWLAEITLETISFWQNISISIFKFSLFLSIKSYQFFKIYERVDKYSRTVVNEKRKTERSWTFFITVCFIKPFQIIINHFFIYQAHLQHNLQRNTGQQEKGRLFLCYLPYLLG